MDQTAGGSSPLPGDFEFEVPGLERSEPTELDKAGPGSVTDFGAVAEVERLKQTKPRAALAAREPARTRGGIFMRGGEVMRWGLKFRPCGGRWAARATFRAASGEGGAVSRAKE